jgi:hypothetical protein
VGPLPGERPRVTTGTALSRRDPLDLVVVVYVAIDCVVLVIAFDIVTGLCTELF